MARRLPYAVLDMFVIVFYVSTGTEIGNYQCHIFDFMYSYTVYIAG